MKRRSFSIAGILLILVLVVLFVGSERERGRDRRLGGARDQGESVEADVPLKVAEASDKAVRAPRYPDVSSRSDDARRSPPRKEPNDPDVDFVDSLSGLPLPLATLEAAREVEKRFKSKEAENSKLIRAGDHGGKQLFAYSVVQPSSEEIKSFLRPLSLLRQRMGDASSKKYVDEKIDILNKTYEPTISRYRLLYALIPNRGGAIEYFSYPASSEGECATILNDELVPKVREVGVPYKGRPGNLGIINNATSSWRLDHLVPKEEFSHVRH